MSNPMKKTRDPMARGTAAHNGEEVEVAFSATGVVTDYGVDRSPTWIEWEDIKIEELTILGHAPGDHTSTKRNQPNEKPNTSRCRTPDS